MSNLGDTGGSEQLGAGWSALDSQDADGGPVTSRLLKGFDLPEGPAASASARHRRIALLTRTIHTEILPKLALSHPGGVLVTPKPARLFNEAELASFTRLVLDADLQACRSQMEDLVAGGAGLSDICLSVLTPTARMLGEMWDDDRCSFVDVTAGLGMLHAIMYRLREICAPALPVRDRSRRILFASLAGNQHTFGLRMVTEVFVNAGWDVTVETAACEADLPGIVRHDWFAIAGLSIARDEQTAHLGQTIRAMRAASFNKTIGILVGGPVFAIQPDLARRVGADVDACDAKQAVLRAEGLRLLMASLRQDAPDR
jgi:methanogenic corrinoid protein MtbC1